MSSTGDVDDFAENGLLHVDEAFVDQMLDDFKREKVPPLKTVFEIIDLVAPILAKEDTLKRIRFSEFKPFVVVGDIHGQFYDLLNIFRLVGKPSKNNSFLFNGDFVDRGEFSLEVILTLFLFKILYPDNVTLLRGNHECLQLITNYGFSEELETKYKNVPRIDAAPFANGDANAANDADGHPAPSCYNAKEALARFAAVFRFLPLAAVLNDGVFVCHGGLFDRENEVLLSDIRAIDRFREPPEEGLMCDLLWSDPGTRDGRRRSRRGLGVVFGPDVTKRFCDVVGNLGAVMVFDPIDGVAKGAADAGGSRADSGRHDLPHKDAIRDGDGGSGGSDLTRRGIGAEVIVNMSGDLRPRIVEFAASPHPSKDKKSLSEKLVEMGLVPRAFPF